MTNEQATNETQSSPADTENVVLVIDDDEVSLELMRRAFTRKGFEVVTAMAGDEGLRLAQELKPTAIILDVQLPVVDGWTILETLKADPELANIPVTMVTMFDERNKGFAMGVSDYLIKPVQRGQLSDLAEKMLPSKAPENFLIVEDDPTNRSILARQLRKRGGTVLEAANGAEALETLKTEPVDMILLDLMMPVMDGYQFLEEVRKSPEHRAVPVVVITAKDLSIEDRGRLSGSVRKVLVKGAYSREEMLREVQG